MVTMVLLWVAKQLAGAAVTVGRLKQPKLKDINLPDGSVKLYQLIEASRSS